MILNSLSHQITQLYKHTNHMSYPKISIVVPVYNAADYLHTCIDSILNQDFKDFELILIDDGSEDNSLTICNEYAHKFGNISVVHTENSGVSSSRNQGIDIATGEWITFIDSDDVIESNYLSSFNLTQYNIDLYVQGYKIFEKDKYIDERHVPFSKTIDKWGAFIELETVDIINSPVCKLFRRNIIQNNHIRFDSKISYGEDHLFCLEYLAYCMKVYVSSSTGYHYIHQNLESLTSKTIPIANIHYYLNRFNNLSCRFQNNTNAKEYILRINERTYSTIKRVIMNAVKTSDKNYLRQSNCLRNLIGTKHLRMTQKCLMLIFKYSPTAASYCIFKVLGKIV